MNKWDLFQGCKDVFKVYKSVNVIHHINKSKNKIHDYLNNAENAFDKIQHPFMINSPQSRYRGHVPQHNVNNV